MNFLLKGFSQRMYSEYKRFQIIDWYFKGKAFILKNTSSKNCFYLCFFPCHGRERRKILLDSNDLLAITDIVTHAVQESEARMKGLIQESEARTNALIQESEVRTNKLVKDTETRILGRVEKMLFKSESMLLKEMDRYDKKNEKRFSKIEQELEGLKDIYRITKNEQETINILLHTMDNFDQRLTVLEAGTA